MYIYTHNSFINVFKTSSFNRTRLKCPTAESEDVLRRQLPRSNLVAVLGPQKMAIEIVDLPIKTGDVP